MFSVRQETCHANQTVLRPFDSDNVAPPGIPLDAAISMGHDNFILLFQTGSRTLQKRGGEGDQGETRSSLKSGSTVCKKHRSEVRSQQKLVS